MYLCPQSPNARKGKRCLKLNKDERCGEYTMSVKAKIITLITVLVVCLGMIVYGTILEENSILDIMPRKEAYNIADEVDTFTAKIPDIDEIWQMQDKEDFISTMSQYIAQKCNYGDNMENLNEKERVFYITQVLEMEVNNGGFPQFFFNSSGMFANELVASFEAIGAKKTSEICKKAISIYGNEVPMDREKREELLTSDDEEEDEKIEALLNECDDEFFEYEDDLLELNYQFILKNKDSFSK